jgi:hypothetical protein
MQLYSRRNFLKIAGISLLGSQLAAAHVLGVDSVLIRHGRTLATLPVFASPQVGSAILTHLWADSVVQMLDVENDWLAIEQGFVERTKVQMMLPTPSADLTFTPSFPFWAEVIAPVAVVRQWCAADAPLVARIGHLGVLRVIDSLPGEHHWYGVEADDGNLLGWTQALAWREVLPANRELTDPMLEIEQDTQMLTVYDRDSVMLRAPISSGASVASGEYRVSRKQAGGTSLAEIHGIPWRIEFGGGDIVGAYWHNRFGTPIPGPAVQISPLVTRWLYRQVTEDSLVIVL